MAARLSPRIRKLVGAVALLALIVVYAVLAVAAAAVLQVNQVGKTAELLFYTAAGLLWVIPAGWLIRWMQQSPE